MNQITKKIYDTYPITKKEKCCSIFRKKMEFKREQLRKRLMNECEGTEKIQFGVRSDEQAFQKKVFP